MSEAQAEQAFGQLWQAHLGQHGQPEGAYKLVDTFFNFLRKTGIFNDPDAVKRVQEIATKHVTASAKDFQKKQKAEEKKEGAKKAVMLKKAQEMEAKKSKALAEMKKAQDAPVPVKAESKEGDDDDDDDDDTPAPVNNGGKTDKYVWGQTLQEVTITIPVPEGTRSRELQVEIKPTTLLVKLKKGETFIGPGELHAKSDSEDATWTIEDDSDLGKVCVIYLPKLDKMSWWSCVMKGGKEIDTKKIVPENSKLDDLDGDVRGTVEKMMYDQKQKKLGLPSSDEQKKQEALQKFMSMHPEMDFSQAKIN